MLLISGERQSEIAAERKSVSVYSHERFAGPFRRAVGLPEDIDPAKVEATYREGVLHVSVSRRESALPKRIDVQ